MIRGLKKAISTYFERRSGVVAVYLFGSYGRGRARLDSDVDIAVLFEYRRVPDLNQQLQIKLDLASLLKKDVDLVVLNRANSVLKFQVLKHGVMILNQNRKLAGDFFARVVTEYADLKRVRAAMEQGILRGSLYG